MKIIDLLNKIANEEEEVPKKIKYKNKIFEHWDNGNIQDYWNEGNKSLFDDFVDCSRFTDLNDEVEIIEDKKIKNVNLRYVVCKSDITDKHIVELLNNFFEENDNIINELIDKLNEVSNE